MQYLTFDDGIVSLGGAELPGLLASLTVSGEVRFDEAKTDGQSGKKKTPMGYEDATVNIDLELLTDDSGTCYDKLTTISRQFKDVNPRAAPKIVGVVNRHLRARNINQVVFSGLSSRETNRDDTIMASLTFTEHIPPITVAENRVVGKTLAEQQAAAKGTTPAAPSAKPNEKVLVIDTN